MTGDSGRRGEEHGAPLRQPVARVAGGRHGQRERGPEGSGGIGNRDPDAVSPASVSWSLTARPTTRRWMDQGTRIFSGALACTSDDALAGPTDLPGWTGRHLVAHVAANAEALLDLAHWASTGEETPMYSSPGQRDADIRAGAQKPPAELRRAAEESAPRLAAALDRLTDEQWSRTVRTARGRPIPASEIPWLRAREVMVHAVDLDPATARVPLRRRRIPHRPPRSRRAGSIRPRFRSPTLAVEPGPSKEQR